VRGSVTILTEPDVYNLDLRDGENCILVNNGDWLEATRRALAMPQRLTPDTVAQHCCSQLLANGKQIRAVAAVGLQRIRHQGRAPIRPPLLRYLLTAADADFNRFSLSLD